jgi:hypothetical protein
MMITPVSAARISAIGVEAICQLVAAGEIHSAEGDAGLLVCLNSVITYLARPEFHGTNA